MTDTTNPQNTTRKPNPQSQTPKKNFFGGEVNFNDPSAFEALNKNEQENSEFQENLPISQEDIAEVTIPQYHSEILPNHQPENNPEEQENSEYDFTNFDPFGDDEQTEETEEIETTTSTQNQEEHIEEEGITTERVEEENQKAETHQEIETIQEDIQPTIQQEFTAETAEVKGQNQDKQQNEEQEVVLSEQQIEQEPQKT